MGVVLPRDGFLRFLRDITRKNGALLIFDEVITGFRLGLGGATEYFGVTPDMVTLGKIIGGGMPVGAYGGRKEIMDFVAPVGPVYQAGTLSGNPIATTAGIETLKLLMETEDLYAVLEKNTERISEAFAETFGHKVCINRVGSLMSVFFTEEKVTDFSTATTSDTDKYAAYFNYMLENNIYIAPSQYEAMFVSYAHTEEDIERTCQVIKGGKMYV